MIQESGAKRVRNWRRLSFRLSLRGMMILILALGVLLGWTIHCARVQRDAVAAIKRAGGSVQYDFQYVNGGSKTNSSLPRPIWLRERLGEDFFQSVTVVQLANPEPKDGSLEALGALSSLELLMISDTARIADGLKHLSRLDSLRAIVIVNGLGIDDIGMAYLARSGGLNEIDVRGSAVTDEGLTHLRKNGRLRRLNLPRSRITDAGVKDLLEANPQLKIRF